MPSFCSSSAIYAIDLGPGHILGVSVCGVTRAALEALIIRGRRGYPVDAADPNWCQHVATLRRLGIPIATKYRLDARGLLARHVLATPVLRPDEATT